MRILSRKIGFEWQFVRFYTQTIVLQGVYETLMAYFSGSPKYFYVLIRRMKCDCEFCDHIFGSLSLSLAVVFSMVCALPADTVAYSLSRVNEFLFGCNVLKRDSCIFTKYCLPFFRWKLFVYVYLLCNILVKN